MAKHTPGPWISLDYNLCGEIEIRSADFPSEFRPLAKTYPRMKYSADGSTVTADNVAECQANARLVCAAPYLLAACEAVVQSWNHPTRGKPAGSTASARAHAVALCEAAIDEAKKGASHAS